MSGKGFEHGGVAVLEEVAGGVCQVVGNVKSKVEALFGGEVFNAVLVLRVRLVARSLEGLAELDPRGRLVGCAGGILCDGFEGGRPELASAQGKHRSDNRTKKGSLHGWKASYF